MARKRSKRLPGLAVGFVISHPATVEARGGRLGVACPEELMDEEGFAVSVHCQKLRMDDTMELTVRGGTSAETVVDRLRRLADFIERHPRAMRIPLGFDGNINRYGTLEESPRSLAAMYDYDGNITLPPTGPQSADE